ncbi:hypothetical protein QJQ45_009058 [Haematococcus lacustris]|nr:hypothetical protein QJQ45_009058 [Haematococcus lacustris]
MTDTDIDTTSTPIFKPAPSKGTPAASNVQPRSQEELGAQSPGVVRAGFDFCDLPFDITSAIWRRLSAHSRRQLLLCSKGVVMAMLREAPAIRLELRPPTWTRRGLPQFLVQALSTRTRRLLIAITMRLPPGAKGITVAGLVASSLSCLRPCHAAQQVSFTFLLNNMGSASQRSEWTPDCTTATTAKFPCLTGLTLRWCSLGSGTLHHLLSHRPLCSQLQQLDLSETPPANSPAGQGMKSWLQGRRNFGSCNLSQLSLQLSGSPAALPSLLPLASHLTRLTLTHNGLPCGLPTFLPIIAPLTRLVCLELRLGHVKADCSGLERFVPCLPRCLHSLLLPGVRVSGLQQLDALLATTQLTRLHLHSISWPADSGPGGSLLESRADSACSWQQLQLDDWEGKRHWAMLDDWEGKHPWAMLARLPLHSLTQPFHIPFLPLHTCPCPNLLAAVVANLSRCRPGLLEVEVASIRGCWAGVDLDEDPAAAAAAALGSDPDSAPPHSSIPPHRPVARQSPPRPTLTVSQVLILIAPLRHRIKGVELPFQQVSVPRLAALAVALPAATRLRCTGYGPDYSGQPGFDWSLLPSLLPSLTHVEVQRVRLQAELVEALQRLDQDPRAMGLALRINWLNTSSAPPDALQKMMGLVSGAGGLSLDVLGSGPGWP